MSPTPVAAVLFDMDGTLLDSEPLWEAALHALAAHHGGALSARARQDMVGRNTAESMAVFYHDLGITDPDPVADNQFVTARVAELFTTDLTWRPGAAELVTAVRQAGVATALVTATGRPLVDIALDNVLTRANFDTVVSGNDVTAPKPHPEPYLTAAARLGVPIHHCVAIEDSPTGLASATAAGAVVVAVPGDAPLGDLNGAHLVNDLTTVDLAYLSRLVQTRAPRPHR